MPRHALKRCLLAGENRDVAVHVTGAAGVAGYTAAVGAARDRRRMGMHVVALGRAVARRMAVHAARIHDHLGGLGEQRAGARLRIGHAGEGGRGAQLCAVLGVGRAARKQHAEKARGERDDPSAHPNRVLRLSHRNNGECAGRFGLRRCFPARSLVWTAPESSLYNRPRSPSSAIRAGAAPR